MSAEMLASRVRGMGMLFTQVGEKRVKKRASGLGPAGSWSKVARMLELWG